MLRNRIATRFAVRTAPPPVRSASPLSAPASSNPPPDLARGLVIPFTRPQTTNSDAYAESARFRSLQALSFLFLVLLPTVAVGVYYFAVSADQYVSEFRFSLRTADPPRVDPVALFDGNTQHLPAALESHVVAQYIASRALVDELDKTIALRPLFAPPSADWWARLDQPASIEAFVEYWRKQVDAFYDPANGTTTVRVRAFTRQDALRLAQAIVSAAERLVNELSARARRDTVRHAEQEVGAAESRLRLALTQIREFRDREGLIDPGKSADATASLAARLRDELAQANAQLSTLGAYMRDDAPPVKVLKARIRSLEAQRSAIAQELTTTGQSDRGRNDRRDGDTLSRALSSFEQLESDRKFAETAYQHALSALDRARADADRQQVYIASFVPPSLPEESLYPRRWRSTGIVALVAFAVWAIGGLVAQSVRDHF
jgi:capsular polysaccharide transport system permease protein